MKHRFLIINADDLALSPGVSEGILQLAARGVVTSASFLPNMAGSEQALTAARDIGLDIGVHLNLCVGAPLLPPHRVRSLLGADGRFAGAHAIARRSLFGGLRLDEVEQEWSAQIEWVLARGARPSHLDSHCQTHALPGLYPLITRLARRYGIRGVRRAISGFIYQPPRLSMLRIHLRSARRLNRPGLSTPAGERVVLPIQQPARFSVLTALGTIRTHRPLQALLQALPAGSTELVTHAGHVDDELRRIDPLTRPREREWQILASSALPALLAREGIRLISWADLPATP